MMDNYSKIDKIKGLIAELDDYINHYHGGSVTFISFDGKIVKISMGGACADCPLSPSTVHGWVEGTLRQFFPEIEGVEEV